MSSSGRAAFLPDALSMKIFSHPQAVRSSTWLSSFWLRVDTRAYPIFAIMRTRHDEQMARAAGRAGVLAAVLFERAIGLWRHCR